MKRTLLLLLAFLFAFSTFADEQRLAQPGVRLAEKQFPTISIRQDRITTQEDYPCGWTADLPSNCRWACMNGQPIFNPDGSQQVRCRPLGPEYEPMGGYCNRYYGCRAMYPGAVCDYVGDYFQACLFLQGSNDCVNCTP
jgi:hypothetical protein